MKHKKLQKKGPDDSDDLSDVPEGSDNLSFEDSSMNNEALSQSTANKAYTGYDVNSIVKDQSSFIPLATATTDLSRCDEDKEQEIEEEIDVVESDTENS